MIETKKITGVILAGGKGNRMGRDKALLRLGEKTFVERLNEMLREQFKEVILSTNVPSKFEWLDIPVVSDIFEFCGPLAGIHSALSVAKTPYIFIVPCDMPLISAKVVEKILSLAGEGFITTGAIGDTILPLVGVYPREVVLDIESFLQAGDRAVLRFLEANCNKWKVVNLTEFADELVNISTPSDFGEMLLNWE